MNTASNRFWTRIAALERPLADGLFAILLLALVIATGWLTARHDRYWDWTSSGSNSLTRESLVILERIQAPLHVTVFADPDSAIGRAVGRLLVTYAQAAPAMDIRYRDPQLFPEQARDADVTLIGQIMLEYRGHRETLRDLGERTISAAIARLTETRAPWIAVIEGHGERSIGGGHAADLGRFGSELRERGFMARPLDLSSIAGVPDNSRLIVLSTPAIALFPGEAEALTAYLDRGGNLLWLMDPGPLNGLEPLAEQLGLTILPGVVVDAAAAKWGVASPAVAVITHYPDDQLTSGLGAPALLPGSLAFDTQLAPSWTLSSYLTSSPQSWNETGRIEGKIDRDEVVGERPGPLAVVLALTRTLPDTDSEQRVLIVGDGDFLSNAQIGTQGNRALGMQMLQWLSSHESLPELPPPPDAVEALTLDDHRRMLIGLGALVLLPALFLTAGLAIRWHRWSGK